MSPTEELRTLAVRKEALRERIAARRSELGVAVREIAVPLQWLDRGSAWWRSMSGPAKLAALPAGVAIAQKLLPKFARPLGVFKYAPIVAQFAKALTKRRS